MSRKITNITDALKKITDEQKNYVKNLRTEMDNPTVARMINDILSGTGTTVEDLKIEADKAIKRFPKRI